MNATKRTFQELETFAAGVCTALGAPADIAAVVAGHLARANLCGHDSHGVLRLPWYRDATVAGELRPAAQPVLLTQTGVAAVFDAQRGFGHHSTAEAMAWALESATANGVGVAAVRRSNHIGRLGEYAEMAVARKLIGVASVGVIGAGAVAPFGGRGPFLGTNPWAFGIPAGDRPLIFDAATSTLAEGKVRVALAKGAELPPGVIVDSEGLASRAPADLYDGGALLPLGGEVAGHKGYGFAVVAALLGGLGMIGDDDPTVAGTASSSGEPGWLGGVFVLAIDPALFGDANAHQDLVEAVLDRLRSQAAAPGHDAVLVPGDPERRARRERLERGVEIPEATMEELDALAADLGIDPL